MRRRDIVAKYLTKYGKLDIDEFSAYTGIDRTSIIRFVGELRKCDYDITTLTVRGQVIAYQLNKPKSRNLAQPKSVKPIQAVKPTQAIRPMQAGERLIDYLNDVFANAKQASIRKRVFWGINNQLLVRQIAEKHNYIANESYFVKQNKIPSSCLY